MNPVDPYAGGEAQVMRVPRSILYKSYQYSPEDGPWGMPPYAEIFGLEIAPLIPWRAGDGDKRPVSVLPPFIRSEPIPVYKQRVMRRMGDPPPSRPLPARSLILVRKR